jgi:hypothetical protein
MKLIWKKLSLSLMVLAPVAVAILWFLWELGRFGNWGLESGYYGQFNRVQHVIEAMSNVEITNSWMHEDISLEDFGFFLLVNGTNAVRVDFWENSPQMKERDKRRIWAYVDGQISSNQASQAIGAGAPQPER